tara:strand:+ start:51354 stop:52637 length:1284 start_codon:yes stop_codon:yes gene_type:complete
MNPILIETLFWSAIALVFYTYAGYPLLVWLMSRRKCQNDPDQTFETGGSSKSNALPAVSIVIAAHREESVILERLNNLAKLDYPSDILEILIGCDGNLDLTGDLVSSYDDERIRLIQFEQRRGKASVLNDCVPQATGEIIVFSDANTQMDPQCIKELVKHFQNQNIGCVCGQLILEDQASGKNVDGLYWKYENFLKHCENKLGAVLGVNGALYALRKNLYTQIPANTINDDFLIGMRIHLAGYQLIYEDSAFATEETAPSVQAEFQRRTRIGTGAFQSLKQLKGLLNPKYGYLAFAFWSHKMLRWFCPVLMAVALLANLCLINNPIYQITLVAQGLFYLSALVGTKFVKKGHFHKFCSLSGMFVQMNLALAFGLYHWVFTLQNGTWERADRNHTAALPVDDLNEPASELNPLESETSLEELTHYSKS